MAYHITAIQNGSTKTAVTTNTAANRDNALIYPSDTYRPERPILINTGKASLYTDALLFANFMFTQGNKNEVFDYCFWDTGASEIAMVSQQNPESTKIVYSGGATNIEIIIESTGQIIFKKATGAAAATTA
jgi:hypothetical protein